MARRTLVVLVAAACLAVAAGEWTMGAGTAVPARPEVMKLSEPALVGTVSVEEAIAKRRSVRSFSDEALTMEQLSQLVWAAQGMTDKTRGLRAAPSAGALYPLEVYVVTKEAVRKYLPAEHALRKVKDGDMRQGLSMAALNQESVAQAPAALVITAVYRRTAAKYEDRAERYVHIEAGAAAENVFLQAAAMGLGSVAVGAFVDTQVQRVIGCEGNENPLLVIPVGKPAKSA